MQAVFNFIGSIFGYILWAVFQVFQNFGVSIIVFTLIFRAILFPSAVKQQRSMAANASLQAKQKEIRDKYANNKAKQNEEIQKLYEKEGVSPMSGCLTSIFPMFIMLGIYYAVVRPLSNVLHLKNAAINQLNNIPGIFITQNNYYSEINALKIFTDPANIDKLSQHGILTDKLQDIHDLAKGFNFLGLDLLSIPKDTVMKDGAFLTSWIIIIPVLCLVTSLGSQILTMKMQGNMMQNQQGCMKYVLYLFPLITVFISYRVPGAVGFYWIWSTIFGFIQTVLLNKFFSAGQMTAKSEAQHVALMELKEAKVKYEYHPVSSVQQNSSKKKK